MTKQVFYQIFCTLFALIFYQTTNAQISIGVRGGILLNNMEMDFPEWNNGYDPEGVTGSQFAVPVEIALGDMFALQPEIMFGSHGTNLALNQTQEEMGIKYTSNFNITIKINTLEVPLLGKVKFGSNKLKFNILAGPSIGFGMNGEAKYKYTYRAENTNSGEIEEESGRESRDGKFVKDGFGEDDVDEDEFPLSKTYLNLHFGGGVAYDFGKASIFLDARYILGISDNFPDYKDADSGEKLTGKSRRIGLSLGVMFPLK
ncbi:MAG: PorT family protein [Lewinellaceae bacterium]|nr:PorT family protein [Lewinellaceae bacterium]